MERFIIDWILAWLMAETIKSCPVCDSPPGAERINGFFPCDCGTHFKPTYTEDTIHDFSSNWVYEREELNHIIRARTREQLNRITSYTDTQGRLLEVGCGPGELLEEASKMGFDAVGVDANEQVIEYCRSKPALSDVDFHCDVLQEADLEKDSFDVVIMSHLIEHVPNPHSLFKAVKRVMKKEGVGYLGTPNVKAYAPTPIRSQFGGHQALDHKVLYSPDSIVQLLSKKGFRQIQTDTSISETDVLFALKTLFINLTGVKDTYDKKRVQSFKSSEENSSPDEFVSLARKIDFWYRRLGHMTEKFWRVAFAPYHIWLAAMGDLPMLHCLYRP